MADKWSDGVRAGSVDVSIRPLLRLASSNLGATGIGAGGVTASYWRQGGTVTAISVSSLGSINAAHSDGGWFEAGDGRYRLDIPDAAFASGADYVSVMVKASGTFEYHQDFPLTSEPLVTGDPFAAAVAILADTDNIQTRLPAALVSGRMASITEAIANGIITEATVSGGYLDAITADVWAEVFLELAQAQPASQPSARNLLMFLYMAFRNGGFSSGSILEVKNDAGQVIAKAQLSEIPNVSFTKDKFIAGP